jgi:hypothetical protein
MVFGRGAERASRVGATVLRHGRRAALIGGFLVAAWAAGAGSAGAEEAEGRESGLLPVADAVGVAEQAELAVERSAQGATALVTDAAAPAADAAPGMQEVLDPVLTDVGVDAVTGATGELPVIEHVPDSLGSSQSGDEDSRAPDGPVHNDGAPHESAPEEDSPETRDTKDPAPAASAPTTPAGDTAPPTVGDLPVVSDAAAQGEATALGGASGSAIIGTGASAGSAFADQVRAPGLPADGTESVVRPPRGIAPAHTEAVEPSVSPD